MIEQGQQNAGRKLLTA